MLSLLGIKSYDSVTFDTINMLPIKKCVTIGIVLCVHSIMVLWVEKYEDIAGFLVGDVTKFFLII